MHVGSGDCGGVAEGLGAIGVGGVGGVVCAVDLCGCVLVGRGGVELGCEGKRRFVVMAERESMSETSNTREIMLVVFFSIMDTGRR